MIIALYLHGLKLDLLLWPYLLGSDDAPATANRGEEKNVLSAASISASRCWPLVVGMSMEIWR